MLSSMRQTAQSRVVKILLGLLALSFGVWGVGGYLEKQRTDPVVEVGRYGVTPQEFSQAMDVRAKRLRQMMGDQAPEKALNELVKQQTVSDLVNRYLLMDYLRRQRLTIGPTTLRDAIAQNPAFANQGRFDPDRYQMVLRDNHLSTREYEQQLTTDLTTGQVGEALAQLAMLPRILVEDGYRREQEKRVVTLLQLDPATLVGRLKPDDEGLQAYLQANQVVFMTEPAVKVRYVVLDPQAVKGEIKLENEEIQTYYDEHAADYRQEEGRRARHILVRVKDGDEQAALTKMAEAEAKVRQGTPFEEVAAAYSDDVTSQNGGDLGMFVRGMMVLPFEEATFALKKVGELSPVVRTDFGYHLIKLEEIRPAQVQTLAEATERIREQLLDWKAVDQVLSRSTRMEDQLGASNDLTALAQDFKLTLRETGMVNRQGEGAVQPLEREPRFLDAAFITPKGELSQLVELSGTRFVAMEVLERQEAEPLTLAVARERILQAWQGEKARQEAETILQAVAKELGEGKTVAEVTAAHPEVQAVKTGPFTGVGSEPEPHPLVRQAAFQLTASRPLHPERLVTPKGVVVVRLEEVLAADPSGFAREEPSLRDRLAKVMSNDLMVAFLESLRRSTRVEVHQEMLKRF